MLTEPFTGIDSDKYIEIELKYAEIYKNIVSDNSNRALRIIGNIEGKPVTAKMLELEALKQQSKGSENVYTEAWKQLKINIMESIMAKQYNIEYEKDARLATIQAKEWMQEDCNPDIIKYFNDLYNAFGMTENEYWDDYTFQLNKRFFLHEILKTHLEDNGIPPIHIDEINSEITDEEYLEKVKTERM